MDDRSRRVERWFHWPMVVAALLVVPVLVVEASHASDTLKSLAGVLNWTTWAAFLVEAVVMLAVVPEKGRWAREHPLELAIIVLTPPFLSSALASVRVLRLLRVLRLVFLVKMSRRLFNVEGLRDAAVVAVIAAVGGGVAFASVEPGRSVGDGLYWALTTMTTLGAGELSSTTSTGKVLTVVVMLVGIGFVALLTGAIAQRFLTPTIEAAEIEFEAVADEVEEDILGQLQDLGRRLQHLEQAVERRLRATQ